MIKMKMLKKLLWIAPMVVLLSLADRIAAQQTDPAQQPTATKPAPPKPKPLVEQVRQFVLRAGATIDTVKTESSSTLNELSVSTTPILGRKFEDLLTLTPGVSIVQGPDGDEISFSGQRGIFNNISLDGGDYNNGFFGEQAGGQRAAIDITLEAVKEFQVVATGASAEFGPAAAVLPKVRR